MMAISPEYRSYLKSPEWDERRQETLRRADYRCERCGKDAPLQAHHLTYKNIFNEPLEDLQALCFDCHKWQHMAKWLKVVIITCRIIKRVVVG